MGRRDKPFHNPFQGLKLEKVPGPAPARPPQREPPPPPAPVPEDDTSLFLDAVGEVSPVRGGPELAPRGPPSPDRLRRQQSEDEEVFVQLTELVAGDGAFDLADSDEFIEGAVAGLDRKILRRLRAGDYAVQAHLDLHGLTRSEARAETVRFVEQARRRGHRCVLVVHGRGLHSKDQIPVLKESLQVWLSRGRIGKQVLAFATARPHDGGAGAVYVLLRR